MFTNPLLTGAVRTWLRANGNLTFDGIFTFTYDFNRRNSDNARSDYTENVFMLRAVGKL